MHGGNRDVCVCGNTVSPLRVPVRGRVAARVPSRGPSRRRHSLLERLFGACGCVSRGRRRVGAGSRPDAGRRVPHELGARAGQPLATRATIRSPARCRGQGPACRVVRAVLAHAVWREPDGRRERRWVPLCHLRGEPLRRNVGKVLATRRRERMAAVSSAPGQHPQQSVPARGSRPGSRERPPRGR